MKRIISLAAAMVLLLNLAGCAAKADSVAPTPDAAPAASAAEVQPVAENPVAEITADPLTGGDLVWPGQRPVAVMVQNAPAALPQWGISEASVVVEALIQGKLTSMMCLFPSVDSVPKVGPVGEGRDLFLQLAIPLNAIPLYISADVYTENLVNLLSYQDLNGKYIGNGAFSFEWDRRMDYNNEFCWYTYTDMIYNGMSNYGLGQNGNTAMFLPFAAQTQPAPAPAEGQPPYNALTLNLGYSSDVVANFIYDESRGTYQKTNADGTPQIDATNETQLSFTNLLVLFASAGVKDNGYTRDYDLSGGNGIYLNQGRMQSITWTKGDVTHGLSLFAEDGSALTVNPGKSYIGIFGGFEGQGLRVQDSNYTDQTLPGTMAAMPLPATIGTSAMPDATIGTSEMPDADATIGASDMPDADATIGASDMPDADATIGTSEVPTA